MRFKIDLARRVVSWRRAALVQVYDPTIGRPVTICACPRDVPRYPGASGVNVIRANEKTGVLSLK